LVDQFVINFLIAIIQISEKGIGILSLCNGIRIFKIGLRYSHLFVKVPRLGDSEVTLSVFELSCHLLLPV